MWDYYFARNFSEVINACKISLTNVNVAIVKDIAQKISDLQMERLEERKDKFISNVYKARIEQKMNEHELYWCSNCEKLLTTEQTQNISCIEMKPNNEENPLLSGRS